MNAFGLRFIEHNIPEALPANISRILAFRVENTLDNTLHFDSHTSFYASPINGKRLHLFVRLNGDFFQTVIVHNNNSLMPHERATLYFPFQASDEGKYQLQIVLSEQHTNLASDEIPVLYETSLQLINGFTGFVLRQKIRHAVFDILYTKIPILFRTLQLNYNKAILCHVNHDIMTKKTLINRCKELNRELAFLEKQVRKTRVASLPCYLGIDTTSKCNLHCKMCFRSHVDVDFNSKSDMSADTLDKLIKDLFPTAHTINFSTIGEPLISKHVEKLLQACSDYQVYLSITTNGTLFRNDNFVKRLASVLHYIEISFDSKNPKRFEALRCGASYDRVLENAAKLGTIRRGLSDPKFNLGFSMTLFRENLEEIPDMLRLVSEVGGNFLKTDIGVIFSKSEFKQSVLSCPDLYNKVYERAHETARETGIRLLMRPPFSENAQMKAVQHGICDYLYVSACIRSEGTLNPCYFEPLSSVSVKKSFRSAWNSEMMQRLRSQHDTDKAHALCKQCYLVLEGKDSVENRKKQFLAGDALS